MRGRGGGRGRFGGRGSVTQDLIRDNLEDLGIDAFQMMENRIPPPLYPPVELPMPIPLTDEDNYLISKNRELTSRFVFFKF
jgi:hypothetical protein